jgi:hypothetical protein
MLLYELSYYAWIIIPITIIVLLMMIYKLKLEIINKKKIKDIIKKKKGISIFVIIVVSFLIFSMTLFSYYIRYIEHKPYKGWYEYEIYIKIGRNNDSIIEFDFPLPHDERLYSELTFYKSYQKNIEVNIHSQYFEYSINDTDYGKVLHISTNNSLFIYSYYEDNDNAIDPNLKLSSERNNFAYLYLDTPTSINCSFWLWFEHTWPIGQFSFDTYTHYLSISKKPFNVPNRILDYNVNEKTNIYLEEGVDLSYGKNQLEITRDEYHMLE